MVLECLFCTVCLLALKKSISQSYVFFSFTNVASYPAICKFHCVLCCLYTGIKVELHEIVSRNTCQPYNIICVVNDFSLSTDRKITLRLKIYIILAFFGISFLNRWINYRLINQGFILINQKLVIKPPFECLLISSQISWIGSISSI